MHNDVFIYLIGFAVLGLITLNALSYYSHRLMILPDIIWVLVLGLCYASAAQFSDIGLPELRLDPNLVLYVFVPPLIFASTQKMCLFHFKNILIPASLTASIGILISMLIIAIALNIGFAIPWLEALLFGAIISATDPLAVGALLNNNTQITESKKLLIEGESILNDGFVITVSGIIGLILFKGEAFSILSSGSSLFSHVIGAVILGAGFGRAARWVLLIWHEKHFTFTINMTLALAFGSFLAAEILSFSGILAVFSAALAYGYKPDEQNTNRQSHLNIWDYFEYITNTLLFFLLGASFFAYTSFESVSFALIITSILLLFLARLGALCALYPFIKLEKKNLDKTGFWLLNFSGARGAVSIALILLLPDDFEFKPLFLSVAFVMIVFSLIAYPLILKRILGSTIIRKL
jgi:CPA1 family monovalent cation:H+ antiporter